MISEQPKGHSRLNSKAEEEGKGKGKTRWPNITIGMQRILQTADISSPVQPVHLRPIGFQSITSMHRMYAGISTTPEMNVLM